MKCSAERVRDRYNPNMKLSSHELAKRTNEGSVIRHDPIPLWLSLTPITARDGHDLVLEVRSSVRVVERDADIQLFKEQFLANESSVTLDTIRNRIVPGLHSTVQTFASTHDAEALIHQHSMLTQLLMQRANEIGFGWGIEFVPPVQVAIRSPTLESRRAIHRLDREKNERLNLTIQSLERVRKLGRFDTLSSEHQTTLLQLFVRDLPTGSVLIPAGPNLIQLDPSTGETTSKSIEGIGPLRSVSRHSDQIYVGGQNGVWTADRVYRVESDSQRGINSVAIDPIEQLLVAGHTDLGLLRWNLETGQPLSGITDVSSPRFLIGLDDRILFACENRVMCLTGDRVRTVRECGQPILRLHLTSDSVWVIGSWGRIERLNRSDLGLREEWNRSATLTASEVMQIEGLTVLAVTGETGPVDLLSSYGAPLLELNGRFQSFRILCGCGRYMTGLSLDRQTVIIWDLTRPQEPVRSINLVARHGHRATDLCSLVG
mgnify:CR=1 FL=1